MIDNIPKDNTEGTIDIDGITVTYNYDELLRIITKKQTIDGFDYETKYTYDEIGRQEYIVYPSGFSIKSRYTNNGFLKKIINGGNNAVLWTTNATNAFEMITEYETGNGYNTKNTYNSTTHRLERMETVKNGNYLQNLSYTYDDFGNLAARIKNSSSMTTESFQYDRLNRLTKVTTGNNIVSLTAYDNLGNILSKQSDGRNLFTDADYSGTRPHAIMSAQTTSDVFPADAQHITYTSFDKVSSVVEGNDSLSIIYGYDHQRRKMTQTVDSITKTKIYSGNCEYVSQAGQPDKTLTYLSGPAGVFAVVEKQGNTEAIHYIHKDHLGSWNTITNQSGTLEQELSFDAWGNLRNPNTWSGNTSIAPMFDRGFTGHEHLYDFGLINMNGRMYDPTMSMMLSPDNYIQSPDFSQNFNRYSYCLNNPLRFTDPSGEIVWAPIIIGAVVGAYMGGTIANNDYNPGNWNYSSGKTWGYMAGGAIVGGISGYVGGAIAATDIPFCNTLSIAGASLTNSLGTYAYTGGQTPISISFGVASYDFTNGEFGYLGKKGNSALENIGYGFGALANLSDVVSLIRGGGQNIKVNSAKTTKDDWWGHSSITDENGQNLVSVGPDSPVQKAASLSDTWQNSIKDAKLWDTYLGEEGTWSLELNNVSTTAISKYASGITRWDLLLNSCIGHTTRALWSAGIPTIYALHPHLLNAQLLIRQLGIYSSPYLYQIP